MKKIVKVVLLCFFCLILVACANKHEGEGKIPATSNELVDMDYMDVYGLFTDNGFYWIDAIPVEDLSEDEIDEFGKVEKVTVAGSENYESDQWLPDDTEIIIYYHSFPIVVSEENLEKSSKDVITDEDQTYAEDEKNSGDTVLVEEPVEESTEESDEENSFWDWLNEGVPEFEFQLNADGQSYSLSEYNYLSPEASKRTEIPNTYEGLPVTAIESQAFYACEELEAVVIPEGIVEIGSYAFYHCGNLKEVVFPESLRRIKEYAFEGCDSLTTVEITTPLSIGFRGFFECESLEKIVLGTYENTVVLDDYAFNGCKKLKEVTMWGVTSIGDNAFQSCEELEIINVSNNLYRIGHSAFEYCRKLKEFNFKGTGEELGNLSYGHWWNKDTGDYEENIIE